MATFKFNVEKIADSARAGSLQFSDDTFVDTPVFMPVGTRASVKAISQQELEEIGYQLILGNSYHLYLRPGTEVFTSFGGLANFMSWPHKILTDSGGFQAFSLSKLTEYQPDGVLFQSHLDGSRHLFSASRVVDVQASFKSDILMPIDDCPALPADDRRIELSLSRTHKWLATSKEHWLNQGYSKEQSLFGIVQGGVSEKFRIESAQYCASLDLPGYSIGGLSVGEKKTQFIEALEVACNNLPKKKPRYLMGVGSIPEIIRAVELGVDMFDCVLPTRNARNGQVFTHAGKVNLRNEKHRLVEAAIDENCSCKVCQKYSLGYIRHLHKMNEILAYSLSTYHNLYFMKNFMKSMREAILKNQFIDFKKKYLALF